MADEDGLPSEFLRHHLLNPLIEVGVLGDELSEDVVLLDGQPFLLDRILHQRLRLFDELLSCVLALDRLQLLLRCVPYLLDLDRGGSERFKLLVAWLRSLRQHGLRSGSFGSCDSGHGEESCGSHGPQGCCFGK